MWTIHFNTNMDRSSVNEDSIYVLDEDNEKLDDITLKWVNDSTVKVINESPYLYDHNYDIYIKDSVSSTRNKGLSEKVHFSFTTQEEPGNLSTQDIIKTNDPKVVMVETDFGQGSGVVIGEGLVLTNEHVVAGMETGTITFNNGDTLEINGIVKADKDKDLALIKTEKSMDVEPVKIGDPDLLTKGDDIVTIGNPMSLQNTASPGMVSGFRDQDVELIQITAPITQGSSGGGLFNTQGELVGITSFILGDSGNLNFAVSTDELQDWSHLFNDDFEDLNTKTTDQPENVEVKLLPFGGVEVNWDEVSEADFHQIYYSFYPDGPFYSLASLEGKMRYEESPYLDIDVESGETYYYSVVAVEDGIESKMSEPVEVVIPEESVSVQGMTKIGMTKREVKKVQEGTLVEETENKLTYKGVNPYNFEYKRDYIFKEGKLSKMEETILLPEHDSKEVISSITDQFIFMANLLYGEPVDLDTDWQDDSSGSFVGAKWDLDSEEIKGSFAFEMGFEENGTTAVMKSINKGDITDNSAPELVNAKTSSANTLELYFNENIQFTEGSSKFLDSITATNLNVDGATAEINDAVLTVTLGDAHQFDDNYQANDLSIQSGSVQDLAGNDFEATGGTIYDGWVSQVQNIEYRDHTENGGNSPEDIALRFDDVGSGDESQAPYDIRGYHFVIFEEGTNREAAIEKIENKIDQIAPDTNSPGHTLTNFLYEERNNSYREATGSHEGTPSYLYKEQLVFNGEEMKPGNYELYVITYDQDLNYSVSEQTSVIIGD